MNTDMNERVYNQDLIDEMQKILETTTTQMIPANEDPQEVWPAYLYKCVMCGERIWLVDDYSLNYCPVCGRKVRDNTDTQIKIDNDVYTPSTSYCDNYKLVYKDSEQATYLKIWHILERQRRLDNITNREK